MLPTNEELRLNLFAQNLIKKAEMIDFFNNFNAIEKQYYLEEIIFLIDQSKPQEEDINTSIKESQLKETYTPCVMLKKGVKSHLLRKLILLPENEKEKVFILLLSLFRVAYLRRFENEKNNPNKWWYWDLSDPKNIEVILRKNNL